MKKNFTLIISLVSLVGVITLAIILVFGNTNLSYLSLETYIGVIATLIGVLVTFAVAWQIINGLEIKDKLAEIDGLKNKVEEQNKTIEQLNYKTYHHLSGTMAMDALENNEAEEAFRYALVSLVNAMKIERPINIERIMKLLEECSKHFGSNPISKRFYDATLKLDKELKSMKDYEFIRTQYEPLIDLYIQKVKWE